MARVALEDWQEQIRDPKIECMSRDEMTAFRVSVWCAGKECL